ncbi:MAG TPA: LLM class flavin-dependent oxidoreductase [Thermomicrobiales bacterium]|nr:LLM class flavin-dependent oxidoreductase [Thermomicrobiales bacterium]
MRVGLITPLHGPFADPAAGEPSYKLLRDVAVTAEREGLHSVWMTDHLIFRFPPENRNIASHEAFTIWAGIAEATSTIELGSLVLCMPFRNPAMMAKLAVSLDEIAENRVTFGIGCGWHKPEFDAFGYPFDNIVSRFDEALQIFHPLLRTGKADFHGKYAQATNCELCPPDRRPGGIPIMIASTQPRMMDLTATYADQWNSAWWGTPAGYLEKVADLDAACARVGRDPKSIVKTAGVAFEFADAPASSEANDPTRKIVGPVELVAETLAAYRDAGCDHVIGNLVGLDTEKTIKFAEAARMAGLI